MFVQEELLQKDQSNSCAKQPRQATFRFLMWWRNYYYETLCFYVSHAVTWNEITWLQYIQASLYVYVL